LDKQIIGLYFTDVKKCSIIFSYKLIIINTENAIIALKYAEV